MRFAHYIESDRMRWCTWENFAAWYELLARDLVADGLAEPNPDWVGRDNITETTPPHQQERIKITKPERMIFMDESAVMMDMTDIERGAAAKVVGAAGAGDGPVRPVTKSSDRISIAPAFLGNGKNLPNTVIWKAKKGVRKEWVLGDDGHGGPKTKHPFKEDAPDEETRHFTSPGGGMTGELLLKVIMLVWLPILLTADPPISPENPFWFFADGHGSRLHLPLLEACASIGLKIYAGVPNGTHLWQPHDTVNFGRFKTLLRKLRQVMMDGLRISKKGLNKGATLSKKHIMRLIRQQFHGSFTEELNRNGVARAGIVPFGAGVFSIFLLRFFHFPDFSAALYFSCPRFHFAFFLSAISFRIFTSRRSHFKVSAP